MRLGNNSRGQLRELECPHYVDGLRAQPHNRPSDPERFSWLRSVIVQLKEVISLKLLWLSLRVVLGGVEGMVWISDGGSDLQTGQGHLFLSCASSSSSSSSSGVFLLVTFMSDVFGVCLLSLWRLLVLASQLITVYGRMKGGCVPHLWHQPLISDVIIKCLVCFFFFFFSWLPFINYVWCGDIIYSTKWKSLRTSYLGNAHQSLGFYLVWSFLSLFPFLMCFIHKVILSKEVVSHQYHHNITFAAPSKGKEENCNQI